MEQRAQLEGQNPQVPTKGRLYRCVFAWLTVSLLFALLLAGLLISIANDLYAFVKPERAAVLEVSAPMELKELARHLEELGVVNNPTVFCLYVRSKGHREAVETFSGTLELNAAMSYRELLSALVE